MRELRTIAASALLTIAAVGCGDDGGGGELTIEEYGAATGEVLCATVVECYGADLAEALGGTECVARFARVFEQQGLPQYEQAIAAGTIVYDPAAAGACLDAIDSPSCGLIDGDVPQPCRDAFRGQVAAGGACSLDEECADEGYCRTEAACPGTCQARIASGGGCTETAACDIGLRCSGGTCRAPALESAACGGDTGVDCAGGLVCVGSVPGGEGMPAQAGTCRSVPELQTAGLGEACSPQEGPFCEPSLACALTDIEGGAAVFSCVAESSPGGTCNLAFPDPCPAGESCDGIDLATGDFEGTCAPLPSPGEPCRDSRCAGEAVCVMGTCRALQNVGGACMSSEECYSGNCDGGTCAEGVLCPGE